MSSHQNRWRLLWLFSVAFLCCAAQEEVSRISGPYLGQAPPGRTPELFAPGVVSTGLDELNSVFSPDGRELYFCVRQYPNLLGGRGGLGRPRAHRVEIGLAVIPGNGVVTALVSPLFPSLSCGT